MKSKTVCFLFLSAFALFSCSNAEPATSATSISTHAHDYELIVTKDAERRTYLLGSSFDIKGLEVSLKCKGCEEAKKVEFTVKDGNDLDLDQNSVHISAEGLTLEYPIRVKEKFRIACVGDSLTKGHMWQNESYPSYLAKKVSEHYEVGNFGENGISITGYGGSWNNPDMRYIKQHFYEDSLAYEPDVIAMMLGTNDATGWANAEATFVEEYHTLLDSYLEKLPFVQIIMMVSPPTKTPNQFNIPNDVIRDQVNPVQRALAKEYGFATIDLREEFEDTADYENLYFRPYDGVHFTTAAAEYVAGRVNEEAVKLVY